MPDSDVQYRCEACGNRTRFDVVASQRTRSFHHYTLGGELEVEDAEVLSQKVESVTCRWCSSTNIAEESAAAGASVEPG